MKKIYITICLFVGLVSFSKAQGNLQFNQVKFIELAGINYNNTPPVYYYKGIDSVTITIPANKVWKIEKAKAVGVDSLNGYPDFYGHGQPFLTLNDVPMYEASSAEVGFGNILWLPAGTYKLRLMARIPSNDGGKFKGFISAIEYNIVP